MDNLINIDLKDEQEDTRSKEERRMLISKPPLTLDEYDEIVSHIISIIFSSQLKRMIKS